MTVPESLRRIRKAHKLTQQDIANVLGVDRTTYTLYETGSTNPPIETLEKLSNMYNATIGYILGTEENNHPERLGKADMVAEDNVDPIAYLSKDERRLLLSYRVLSEQKKEQLRQQIAEALKEE
ncbi:MAG: helix-turn-helix transcriptional regulator [Clostridia bacterium]|nr:helix-turn-helix transcriptional regulator [Clostridia bacterium]